MTTPFVLSWNQWVKWQCIKYTIIVFWERKREKLEVCSLTCISYTCKRNSRASICKRQTSYWQSTNQCNIRVSQLNTPFKLKFIYCDVCLCYCSKVYINQLHIHNKTITFIIIYLYHTKYNIPCPASTNHLLLLYPALKPPTNHYRHLLFDLKATWWNKSMANVEPGSSDTLCCMAKSFDTTRARYILSNKSWPNTNVIWN